MNALNTKIKYYRISIIKIFIFESVSIIIHFFKINSLSRIYVFHTIGSSVFHSIKNEIYKTACQQIQKAWVNDTQNSCQTGLPIKFFDNSNTEKKGFLTKYFGIISDNAPIESCTRDSTFTLPSLTLVRKQNKVVKIPNKSSPAIFFNSENYDFFDFYKKLAENGSFIFFRDFVFMFVMVIVISILFGKKRCLFVMRAVLNKVLTRKIDFDSESEHYVENYNEKFNDIDKKMIDIKFE